MSPMNPVKRRLLTLALVAPLALVAALAALAPLGAGHRALAGPEPNRCPETAGYALASVERDPTTFRYADRNGDGLVCLRFPAARVGTVLLIETIGDPNQIGAVGAASVCPAPFSLTTADRLPSRELVGDFRLVDRNGDGFACLAQLAGRYNVVVIDNTISIPYVRAIAPDVTDLVRQRNQA